MQYHPCRRAQTFFCSVASVAVVLVATILAAAQAHVRWDKSILRQSPEWYSSAEARAVADNVIRWQSPQGGWPKNTDISAPALPEAVAEVERHGSLNTIDNGATTTPLQFLVLMVRATRDPRYREAFLHGLDYLLAAQYPSGGWPQYFPLRKGYHSHITYNDDAMIHVLQVLRAVSAGKPPYDFVDATRRNRAASAVSRGIECILHTQIRQNGKLTAWCAQHDTSTLEPTWARNFEPPSLSGGESVGIVRFLMEIEQPTSEIIAAIEAAVEWFRAVAIRGVRLEEFNGDDGKRDRRVVADPRAGALWARFYELGTNRPIFTGRDKIVRYALSEIEYERRNGYAYYVTGAANLLNKDYPRWRAKHGDSARIAASGSGDPARGRELFFDAGRLACARCHRARGQGGDIGPDLSDIGAKFDRPLLVESVLEPSRQIVEGYRTTIIATSDGRVLSGIAREESPAGLVLTDGDGKKQHVSANEIEERMVAKESLMPSGLAAGISNAQFADLIAFLESLRSTGPLTLPAGFTWARVARGITGATAMAIAPDGRIFVCEQTGALRVVKGDRLLDVPFLTMKVDSTWERGLIGVAIHPEFARNHFVYVNYVVAEPYPHHRLSRFQARGDTAEPDSEKVLLEGDDQSKVHGTVPAGHQGGAIHFGKDAKLYWALGEQTAGAPSQAMDSLLGKLLRVNADGSIPVDNPFYKQTSGKYRAIWALGLRNPFTFAVQPETGRIFINDVGQSAWEEIDEGFGGANYGWPASEGPTTDPKFRGPIHHYPVASIAGGAFCPQGASQSFAAFRGQYFFADFIKGWIKVLDPVHPERVKTFAAGLARPVDLQFAPDGSLYVLERDAWVIDDNFRPGTGRLLKISHARENAPRSR